MSVEKSKVQRLLEESGGVWDAGQELEAPRESEHCPTCGEPKAMEFAGKEKVVFESKFARLTKSITEESGGVWDAGVSTEIPQESENCPTAPEAKTMEFEEPDTVSFGEAKKAKKENMKAKMAKLRAKKK